ncbi:MAG: OprO/OprP family phosphate-selective porin [Mangrovibacterium sp.]
MKQHFLALSLMLLLALATSAQDDVAESTPISIPATVSFDKGKLTFKNEEQGFKLWLDSRVYVDAAAYSPKQDVSHLNSKPNKDLEFDDGQFRFSNGIIIRRARFAVKATLYHNWFSELDFDFAYNEVEIKDMFIGYKFNDHISIKAGNFKEPMSMERMTSSKYITSAERPMAVDAFAAGRSVGIAATAWNDHWWVSGGFFGEQTNILHKEKNRGNSGYAFTGRAAVSPINNESTTIHIGAYGTYRTPDALGQEDRFVQFRCFPESRVDRRRFVRTEEIANVNHYTTSAMELAFRHEKWLLQGEYIFTNLSRYKYVGRNKVDLDNATFDGWYCTASYAIFGKNRTYSPEDAEFETANPAPKTGNLELAARVSAINLNDFHEKTAVITGGSALNYTAALNWYPNRNVLIGFNYSFMDQDKYADDKGHITQGGISLAQAMPSGIDFSTYKLRLMISF